MLKKVNLNIKSYIDNLDDSASSVDNREVSEASHSGAMKLAAGELSLSYRENTEGGSVFSDILIHESGAVTVRRTGAIDSTLHFDTAEEFNTVYSLPPYKFDMNVKTERISNTLSIFGGSLEIEYLMTVGGAKKHVNMIIDVSEEKK